jgi:hypothetical protein
MRWNPCGRFVDFGEYPFRETIRPFRDSDEEVIIDWYPCLDTAPNLGVPTCLYNRYWDRDEVTADGQPIYDGRVPPRKFYPVKPAANGAHRCGSDEDFAEGGEYRPDLPPVVYRPDGLPLCCGAQFVGIGGGKGGGEADVIYQPPPGPSCSTAGILTVGVPYAFVTDGRTPGDYWFSFTAPSTGIWRFTGTGVAAAAPTAFAGICPGGPFFFLVWTGFTADCVSIPLNAGDQIWVVGNIIDTGTLLTITPGSGAC